MELLIFLIMGAVAVISAMMMILSANAVHSVLFLILNFICVAFFFLTLNAPFLAMVQITVYAGAIMVLFLFVIMLLGAERLRQTETRLPWQNRGAIVLGVLLGIIFVATILVPVWQGEPVTAPAEFNVVEGSQFGDVQSLGLVLFSDYLLPFELLSILLLVAMIGAIVFTRDAIRAEMSIRRQRLSKMRRQQSGDSAAD